MQFRKVTSALMHNAQENVEEFKVFILDTAIRLLLLRFFSRTCMVGVLKLLMETYLQICKRETVVAYY